MIQVEKVIKEMQIRQADHLPLISAYCDRIGLVSTIDAAVPSQMNVSPGEYIKFMIIDILSGRNPLYRLEEFAGEIDVELLVGRDIEPVAFCDTNIARVLDAVFKTGSQRIFSQVAFNAAKDFELDMSRVNFDTTSVSLWGNYSNSSDETDAIHIARGYSKDHRPDLKQFMIKALCVERNIPVLGGCIDGNSSDKKVNNDILQTMAEYMGRHGLEPGAFIYTADSALITEDNLKEMENLLFISRLPFNFTETGRVVTEAVEADEWEDVGTLVETPDSSRRPAASYRVHEASVELYGNRYRAVVVHSSAHDKRRHKKLDRQVEQSLKTTEALIKKASKTEYYCEADAAAAGKRLSNEGGELHEIEVGLAEKITYKRGRPAKGKDRQIERTTWHVTGKVKEKAEALSRRRKEAGCFVMITNVPQEGQMALEPGSILKEYKTQHGIERNFGFLKDPLIVNDTFLKKPERIEALGSILLMALLIWTLMEKSMRDYVAENGTTLPGWDKKRTTRPTSFMMSMKFRGVKVVRIDGKRYLGATLTDSQKEYLTALGLTEDFYIRPKEKL